MPATTMGRVSLAVRFVSVIFAVVFIALVATKRLTTCTSCKNKFVVKSKNCVINHRNLQQFTLFKDKCTVSRPGVKLAVKLWHQGR